MEEIRLLLADKNLSYLEVAKKMLKYHDDKFVIDIAISGEECIQKLLDYNYGLLLLDYGIDEDRGVEILKRIVRSGFEIPIIMMVEDGREDIAFKALEYGAADYIMKVRGYLTALPFTVGKVIERQKLKAKKVKDTYFDLDLSSRDQSSEKEEAYYILDRRGRFISASKSLETLSEYNELEILELTLLDIIPREQESKYNQWLSALDLGYNNNSFKTELVGKYGSRKRIEISLNPVRDRDGEITSYKGKLVTSKNLSPKELPTNGFVNQTRMIQEITDIINSSYNESLNHLLQRITKSICQIFQFKRATLALLDRRRKVFVKQTMVGFLNSNNYKARVKEVPQEVIEKAFTDNFKIKVMYFDQNLQKPSDSSISDISERRSQERPSNQRWHPKDMIILNLIDDHQQTFGYISLDHPVVDNFPQREVFYNLELFTGLASLAIENYYRYATIEKRNRRLKQLLVTSNIFKLHLSLTEMLNEIVWSIKFTLDFNLVMLGLISKKSGMLEIKSLACDDKVKSVQIKELKFSITFFKRLFKKQYKKGKSYFVYNEESVLKDLKDIYYHSKIGARGDRYWPWWALLVVPIRNKDNKIIGFLMVDDPADCLIPSAENIHTLEILAVQISVAIENRLIYLELKERALNNTSPTFQFANEASDRRLRKFVDKIFK